jgi:hypothetical protein
MKGLVYVFKQLHTEHYKIGMTCDESVKMRFISFNTYSPTGAEIICIIKTDHAANLEKKLHQRFKDKRMNGEWFKLSSSDVVELRSMEDLTDVEIKNFFYTYILDRKYSKKQIKLLFARLDDTKTINYDLKESENKIIAYLEENFNNSELTNTEIINLLKNINIEIGVRDLGIILKKYYSQKIKKIEGRNMRLYKIKQ